MLEAVPTTPDKGKQEVKKKPKVRLEPIRPNHIADVWRLYEHFVRDTNRKYPDLSEESSETIQSHLFNYLQHQTFSGLQAKVGKNVVGIVMGNVIPRPLGRPKFYLSVQCLWVEPRFRRQGIATSLWNEYASRLKRAEVFNFEAWVSEEQAKRLPADRLIAIVGGRL